MDWDHKFNSIIRETEANLAKVQQHLGSARSSSFSALSAPSSTRPYNSRLTYRSNTGSPKHVSFDANSSYQRELSAPDVTTTRDSLSIDSSPAVFLLLKDKLDEQERMIGNLARTVRRLENEKEHHNTQLKHVKEELSCLSNRVLEKGVDLQTERKVEQCKRDMFSEMKVMQSQLDTQRSREDSSRYSEGQLSSVMREVHQMKRFIQEECDSFRRDAESVKTRLVKIEFELASTSVAEKDASRRHDRMDRTLRELSDSQRTHSRELDRTQGDKDFDKSQLTELRTSMQSLRDKIDSLEERSLISTKRGMDRPTKESSKRKQGEMKAKGSAKIKSSPLSLSPDLSFSSGSLSDLDLLSGETSLADYNSSTLDFQHNVVKDDLAELDDLDLSDVDTASTAALDVEDL